MISQFSTHSHNIITACLFKPFFCLHLIFCIFLFPAKVFPAESESSQIIILSQDNNSGIKEKPNQESAAFIATDIVPLPSGGNIIALIGGDSSEPVYRFNLVDTPLVEILDALVITFNAEDITVPGQPDISANVVIKDLYAHSVTITTQVELTPIGDTIDHVAIASDCNIYLERKSIIVDLCGH